MSRQLTVTYNCCKATYTMPIGVVGDGLETLHALDRLHDAEHPQCWPIASTTDGQR